MAIEIKIPEAGESVSEVEIAEWLVSDGDYVEKDQDIAVLDSDKASLELPAEESGKISIKKEAGSECEIGEVIGEIDTDAEAPEGDDGGEEKSEEKEESSESKDSKKEAEKKKEKKKKPKKKGGGEKKEIEVKVPSPGESISEVEIAQWMVSDGDYVKKDQVIAELDSDKATLELSAEESGEVSIKKEEGSAEVGEVVATINVNAEPPEDFEEDEGEEEPSKEKKSEKEDKKEKEEEGYAKGHPSPAAKKAMDENDVDASKVKGSGKGGRVTKQDVADYIAGGVDASGIQGWGGSRDTDRKKMSMLRRKVAERLVSVKNDTAMLTTFNEVDMKPIMDLRKKYKEKFKEEKEVGLGFMSFFTKAVTEALNEFPAVNAMIDGKEIIYHDYADIGIAVSSPKGLMVPVVRNAEQMSLAEIEKEIKRLAVKARDGKISMDEMQGGTFTITNGGVFGSMLSTPIINPPQSAILGMHNIVERPVAVDGEVRIRPIMYVALSYDHRIIDGKESVSFLVKVKEMLENPAKLIFGGKDPEEVLLGL